MELTEKQQKNLTERKATARRALKGLMSEVYFYVENSAYHNPDDVKLAGIDNYKIDHLTDDFLTLLTCNDTVLDEINSYWAVKKLANKKRAE